MSNNSDQTKPVARTSRIAREVAEQIAQAIEAEARDYAFVCGESPMPEGSWHAGNDRGILYGLRVAARVAREWGAP